MIWINVLTVSLLRSDEGACKKFSFMYVNMPAEAWKEWYAVLRPDSSDRVWKAAWQERTADMLKMIEAFSKASEYCAVDLWVKASNLERESHV